MSTLGGSMNVAPLTASLHQPDLWLMVLLERALEA